MRATRRSAAFLAHLVQRLRQALERKHIAGGGAARRRALDGQVGALAHGVDQTRLLGGILDPGAVGLGVHGVGGPAHFERRVRIALEAIADDERDLVLDLFGRTRRHEQKRGIARAAGRGRLRVRRLGEREAHLLAGRRRCIGAPVAEGAEQCRLHAADGGRGRRFGRRSGRRRFRFRLGGRPRRVWGGGGWGGGGGGGAG